MNRWLLLAIILPRLVNAQTPVESLKNLPSVDRPNVLFILSDDQRWDSLGCNGNKNVRTPNLDRLAEEGARFNSFTVASPICSASRASLLTGLFPHQSGIVNNMLADYTLPTPTVADYFNDAGYVTGFIGKAHLGGDPRVWGFKQTPIWLPAGWANHLDPKLMVNGEERDVQGHITNIFSSSAINFIQSNKDNRWFLWLATTAPHLPYVNGSIPSFWDNTREHGEIIARSLVASGKEIPGLNWLFSSFLFRWIEQTDPGPLRFTIPEYELSSEPIVKPPEWPKDQDLDPRSDWLGYYSTIQMLDTELGRVLRELEDLNLAHNTLVIFISDNGFTHWSHEIKEKGWWYREAINVPAIVRWPEKVKPGTELTGDFNSVDLLSTYLDLLGVTAPSYLQGHSLISELKGEPSVPRDSFSEIGTDQRGWRMIISENYKYVEHTKDGETKKILYNLILDSGEQHNLAMEPQYEELVKSLASKLLNWRTTTKLP